MAANFDRWEKDQFFSAAEEVQESADRMESIYRTWQHSTKNCYTQWNLDDLRRDLSTSLDTVKWQLEEFERAVRNSYKNDGADESEAKTRHQQFVLALENKISQIKKSLQESAASYGKPFSPRVRLDEEERDELALFLSVPDAEVKDEKFSGHRRTASASADISSWNIAIHEEESASDSSSGQLEVLPRRIPSFSTFVGTMESVPKLKLPEIGFRKWKPSDIQPPNRGSNAYYERNKSCVDSCDDCYDKQLYGWYGAVRRLLQRSLYQLQYTRSIQITFGTAFLIFFTVLFLVCVF